MVMLTIKKRWRAALAIVAAACLTLTACAPPGERALHKGDRLLQDGQFAEAIDQLRTATELLAMETNTAVSSKAFSLLGLAYQQAGRLDLARQAYQNALKLNRNLAEADYNLGCLELQQTNLLRARDYFITYTSLRPGDANGFMQLGVTYYREAQQSFLAAPKPGFLANAKTNFVRAQNLVKTAEVANFLGLIAIQTAPVPSQGSISNAIAQFKDAVAHDPHYAPALLNLAIVYDEFGKDPKDALFAYGQYLHLTPLPPRAREIAVIMTNIDQHMRFVTKPAEGNHPTVPSSGIIPPPGSGVLATAATNKAVHPSAKPLVVETAPATAVASNLPAAPGPVSNSPPPTFSPEPTPTAVAMITPAVNVPAPVKPQNEEAPPVADASPDPVLATTSAPAHKPSKLNPLNWFGGRTKPADATDSGADKDAVATLTVTPLPAPQPGTHYVPPPVMMFAGNRKEADRQLREGIAAEKSARPKDAISFYQEAIKADPGYYEACEALGVAANKSGDDTLALEAFNHALTIKPDSEEAHYGFAWALEKKHYYQDAVKELEKLLVQKPDEVRAHLLLAEIYARDLGEPDQARPHYQKVLAIEPQNSQATTIRFWLRANPER
jgi:tetratricopeptide (TPR) repeat protein